MEGKVPFQGPLSPASSFATLKTFLFRHFTFFFWPTVMRTNHSLLSRLREGDRGTQAKTILDYTRRLLNLLLPPLNTSTLKLHCLLSRRRNQSLDDAPPVCTLARLGRVERGNGVGEVVPCPTQIQPKVSFKREGREGRGGVRCVMRGASFTAPDETRWIAVGCKKRKNEEKEGSARRQESVLTFASAGKMRGSPKRRPKTVQGGGESESEEGERK